MTNQEKAERIVDAEMNAHPDVWATDRVGERKRLIREALSILGQADRIWRSEGRAELAAESVHESFHESWENSDENDEDNQDEEE